VNANPKLANRAEVVMPMICAVHVMRDNLCFVDGASLEGIVG
jgi:hypothetical protein